MKHFAQGAIDDRYCLGQGFCFVGFIHCVSRSIRLLGVEQIALMESSVCAFVAVFTVFDSVDHADACVGVAACGGAVFAYQCLLCFGGFSHTYTVSLPTDTCKYPQPW
jgi:hypothetical protein